MPKILIGGHAELFGETMVEPGQEIPNDADKDLVTRLTDEGRITDIKPAELKKAQQQEEEDTGA